MEYGNSDAEVKLYYFKGNAQQSSQELAFQTLHNSVLITNEAGDTLLSEGTNPFFDNGQGAYNRLTNLTGLRIASYLTVVTAVSRLAMVVQMSWHRTITLK